jgi:L-fucose mutarotase/ribose pyranase (RbsD/FucU family)
MVLTEDGRKVQAIYDGNVVVVFVDEYANSRFAKRTAVFAPGCHPDFYRKVEQDIAANGGTLPYGYEAGK